MNRLSTWRFLGKEKIDMEIYNLIKNEFGIKFAFKLHETFGILNSTRDEETYIKVVPVINTVGCAYWFVYLSVGGALVSYELDLYRGKIEENFLNIPRIENVLSELKGVKK